MGASIQNIVFLLSKEFLILVLIANIIAWPFVYYFMNSWLEGFANRIDLHWSLFVVGGILVSLIAFLTVAYKTIQTANSNPIKALRYQ
jgi:putative ABC transport system permease protein